MKARARIGVVGCGALGSYYGARLARAGHDVHFLVRSDFGVVRENGVRILDAEGGFRVHPAVARTPEEIGVCDLVLIGLKTTANAAFGALIPPLVGPGTAVLTLQNGLGSEEALADLVGAERVLGGLCIVCLNRIAPGVIRHHAYGRIKLGEFRGGVSDRAERIADWFRESGVPCDTVENLERAHWEKLVWNIPFNGLGVGASAGYESVLAGRRLDSGPLGACAATDVLLGDVRWASLVQELMEETIGGAQAQGLELESSVADFQIGLTRQMASYKASTLIDFERGLPLEVDALFAEPLRRVIGAGAAAPRLEKLVALLRELDPGRQVA